MFHLGRRQEGWVYGTGVRGCGAVRGGQQGGQGAWHFTVTHRQPHLLSVGLCPPPFSLGVGWWGGGGSPRLLPLPFLQTLWPPQEALV